MIAQVKKYFLIAFGSIPYISYACGYDDGEKVSLLSRVGSEIIKSFIYVVYTVVDHVTLHSFIFILFSINFVLGLLYLFARFLYLKYSIKADTFSLFKKSFLYFSVVSFALGILPPLMRIVFELVTGTPSSFVEC